MMYAFIRVNLIDKEILGLMDVNLNVNAKMPNMGITGVTSGKYRRSID